MEVAEELDISPLEALLLAVRQAGGRVAWTDHILRERMRAHVEGGGDPTDPPKDVLRWMGESRRERGLFARTAQVAVTAGVATALVQRVELEGTAVADAVAAALDALDLTSEQRVAALGAAQDRLLALE